MLGGGHQEYNLHDDEMDKLKKKEGGSGSIGNGERGKSRGGKAAGENFLMRTSQQQVPWRRGKPEPKGGAGGAKNAMACRW